MDKQGITRRDFLRVTAAGSLAAVFMQGLGSLAQGETEQMSRVVLIRDQSVLLSAKEPDPQVVRRMLDQAVCALVGEKDPAQAWQKLIKPEDTVGIKTNNWKYLPTTAAVEQALRQRVQEAGVPESRIGIDDRGVRGNPLFQQATALINARPARTHHWSGMGSCIKNYIMFAPKPSAYHDDSCADLAKIWQEFNLKDRTRLNVLVMFTPLFHGIGPHNYSDDYVWEYKGMIVGTDPVAVDATGLRILQAKRQEYFKEEKPLVPAAKHIALADTRHHLGTSDPRKIELIRIGWEEGRLI